MEQFDVFLCHNSKDKPAVIQVAQQLQDKGIKPWLDIWHLRPGFSWQRALEQQINQIASAAVFVGKSGLGPWQSQEVDAFLRAFVNRQCPVIPVLLSNAPTKPQLPLFLQGLTWVDFRQQHPDPMEQLIWGITGHRPNTQTGTGSSRKDSPIIDRREFLKWAGWGSVGLVTTVVGREIFIKLNQPTATPSIEAAPTARPFATPERKYTTNTPSPENTESISLESEKGIDYTRLRDLLEGRNWKEADQETYEVMKKVLNNDWSSENLLNFPCKDLSTIDQLWVKYSNGHFGFSVQKEIYLSVGGKADGEYYKEAWEKLGDRVGWRVNSSWISYSNVIFDTSSPKGHLPLSLERAVGGLFWWLVFSSLASRLVKCNI